ncbi:SDR family oxidoreductase [Azospirillum sp. HJ39]|uniref:SDR family NAD(P)-dependent oxidoreductase n=1 Tax=Azospirillum sp. HJ39 TaxID=3159496 RepID=UPI003558C38B
MSITTDMGGRVVLVTGGTSGIGRATALAFGQAGATVIVTGRREAEGQETVAQIGHSGGVGSFVAADVADAAEVAALFGRIERDHGRLDAAFNNAGIHQVAPLTEMDDSAFDRILTVNVKGVWLCLKHELAIMKRQGHGSIVNTGSVLGQIGMAGNAAYSASKAAVEGLTRTAAIEVAASGVRVNAVCPAIIQTPMTQGSLGGPEQVEAVLGRLHPVGRVGRPEEVAAAVLWLCSDSAGFVTGQSINIDGGVTAQ